MVDVTNVARHQRRRESRNEDDERQIAPLGRLEAGCAAPFDDPGLLQDIERPAYPEMGWRCGRSIIGKEDVFLSRGGPAVYRHVQQHALRGRETAEQSLTGERSAHPANQRRTPLFYVSLAAASGL